MNIKNIVHALQSEFGFKPKPGGGLTGGRCPACGEPEAYTPPTNPHIILCPRANQCGVRTLTKSVLPSLYQVRKSHPPTATNPMATAKAYLQTRGLSTQGISKAALWQGSYTLRLNGRNHDWPTVAFMLENGSICHRLIDWTGKGKTRMQGKFQGLVWLPKPLHIEPPPRKTTLWLVEGCMDALSLNQVGLNAVAILSASHVPTQFLKDLAEKYLPENRPVITVGLDGDAAGQKGTKKLLAACHELGFHSHAAVPPKNRDWNDLLVSGQLDGPDCAVITRAVQDGAVMYADDPQKAFAAHRNISESPWFIWRGCYYRGKPVADAENAPEVRRISDFTLRPRFVLRRTDPANGEVDHVHYVEIINHRHAINAAMDSKVLTNHKEFKTFCLGRGLAQWTGNGVDLEWIVSELRRFNPPNVSQVDVVGYDTPSDCYFFKDDAYGPDGTPLAMDDEGFYVHRQMRYWLNSPDGEKANPREGTFNYAVFMAALRAAYGDKALACVGFLTASLFAEQFSNRPESRFFPILSFFGALNTGKTAMMNLLNRLCGRNVEEGLPINSVDTAKGNARSMAGVSNLPLAVLEMDAQKAKRFDISQILTLYNRAPLQLRAQRTHDNRTSSMHFKGALMFVQNHEPFSDAPQKSRICSMAFEKDTTNIPALVKLMKQPVGQLAGFRHQLLQKRKLVLETFLSTYPAHARTIHQHIKSNRVAGNYAVLLAGIDACATAFDGRPAAKEATARLLPYLLECAKKTEQTMQGDSDLVALFFEALQRSLTNTHGFKLPNYAPIRPEKEVWISLTEALEYLSEKGSHWPKVELAGALKNSPSFISCGSKYIAAAKRTMRVWAFKAEAILPNPPAQEGE